MLDTQDNSPNVPGRPLQIGSLTSGAAFDGEPACTALESPACGILCKR